MSDWSGFTDADLKKMRQTADGSPNSAGPRIVKPVIGGRSKPVSALGQKSQKRGNVRMAKRSNSKENGDVPRSAMLSKAATARATAKKVEPAPATTPTDQIPLHGKSSPSPDAEETPSPKAETVEPEILEDPEAIKKKEKLKLEDVHQRQKEMEEKNKRKKTMLSKAIAERKKKAFAESTKLIQIQSELSKLDVMLNYDVSVLRDKIDEACQEYNAAQKRFEKAEAEYITSKMNLHKATEMKEDLTEHLYQLIQLNEERKANKLEELMQKLELEESEAAEEEAKLPESPNESPKPDSLPADSKSNETPAEGEQPKSESVEQESTNDNQLNSSPMTSQCNEAAGSSSQ